MALSKGSASSGYDNVWYDIVLKGLKSTLTSEIPGVRIYIAPSILYADNYQIRIWGAEANTESYGIDYWNKTYTSEIFLYMIDKNPQEKTYEQLYSDSEKLYQALHNVKSKTLTSSNNSFTWLDGKAESITVNDFEEEEEDIDGLLSASFTHTCVVERAE